MHPAHKLQYFDGRAHSNPKLETTEPLAAAIQHFADCVELGLTPISCGASALRGIRLLTAADRSLRNHGMEIAVGRRLTAA